MNKMIRKTFLVALLIAAGAIEAHAVPSLGVASSSGYVNATDAYQFYWGPSLSAPAGQDGFAIGASGSNLHIWSNIVNADIYVLTTSDVRNANNITFNGSIVDYPDTGTFMSYAPTPYSGINVGKIGTTGWNPLPSSPFTPRNFYSTDVKLNYTGDIGVDQWIFAAADTNGVAGLQATGGSFWTDNNGLSGIQEKRSTIWTESNGLAGIQTEDTEVWVDDNGLLGIQDNVTRIGTGKNKRIVKADTFKEYEEDTYKIYEADAFTRYGSDVSSPKTTSARGFDVPQPVPEPSTFILFGAGLAGIAFLRRRNKK